VVHSTDWSRGSGSSVLAHSPECHPTPVRRIPASAANHLRGHYVRPNEGIHFWTQLRCAATYKASRNDNTNGRGGKRLANGRQPFCGTLLDDKCGSVGGTVEYIQYLHHSEKTSLQVSP
jgi:hypothetical protein